MNFLKRKKTFLLNAYMQKLHQSAAMPHRFLYENVILDRNDEGKKLITIFPQVSVHELF